MNGSLQLVQLGDAERPIAQTTIWDVESVIPPQPPSDPLYSLYEEDSPNRDLPIILQKGGNHQ